MSSYPITDAVSRGRTRVVLADDDVLLREGPAGLLGRSVLASPVTVVGWAQPDSGTAQPQ